MTTYNSAHNGGSAYCPDEVGYRFCLQCLTPIIVGLFVYDITMYNKYINGYDSSPLIELLADGEIGKFFFRSMLSFYIISRWFASSVAFLSGLYCEDEK